MFYIIVNSILTSLEINSKYTVPRLKSKMIWVETQHIYLSCSVLSTTLFLNILELLLYILPQPNGLTTSCQHNIYVLQFQNNDDQMELVKITSCSS